MNQSVQHASSFREHLELHKSIPPHSFKSYNAQFDPLTSPVLQEMKIMHQLIGSAQQVRHPKMMVH
jgi:hypothetical protein